MITIKGPVEGPPTFTAKDMRRDQWYQATCISGESLVIRKNDDFFLVWESGQNSPELVHRMGIINKYIEIKAPDITITLKA